MGFSSRVLLQERLPCANRRGVDSPGGEGPQVPDRGGNAVLGQQSSSFGTPGGGSWRRLLERVLRILHGRWLKKTVSGVN
jgi:hypothetical protein